MLAVLGVALLHAGEAKLAIRRRRLAPAGGLEPRGQARLDLPTLGELKPLSLIEHVFEEMMAARCSFCGSTSGPFAKVEGLSTVLMCRAFRLRRG